MPDPHGLAGYPDVALLGSVAEAIVDLGDVGNLPVFRLPYPASAQRALDRLVLRCLERKADPPQSLMELVVWCATTPVEDWPLDLPNSVGKDGVLVDPESLMPTELCLEWTLRAPGSRTRAGLDHVLMAVGDRCRRMDSRGIYGAFRRQLRDRPVIDDPGQFEIGTDPALSMVLEVVPELYEQVPDHYLRNGAYRPCGRCSTLLVPWDKDQWWCERGSCRAEGDLVPGKPHYVSDDGPLYQLARPLRQFVTDQERFGAGLVSQLATFGLSIEPWYDFGLCDLRVVLPDQRRWAIDFKDWTTPAFLAGEAVPTAAEARVDEVVWVVPRRRLDAEPDYLAILFDNFPKTASAPRVLLDDQLLPEMRRLGHA